MGISTLLAALFAKNLKAYPGRSYMPRRGGLQLEREYFFFANAAGGSGLANRFHSGHLLGLLRDGKMDDSKRICAVSVYRGGSSWSDCVVDTTLCPTECE